LAGRVGPPDEVRAVLADVGERRRDVARDLAVDADRIFVGPRGARVGVVISGGNIDPGLLIEILQGR